MKTSENTIKGQYPPTLNRPSSSDELYRMKLDEEYKKYFSINHFLRAFRLELDAELYRDYEPPEA